MSSHSYRVVVVRCWESIHDCDCTYCDNRGWCEPWYAIEIPELGIHTQAHLGEIIDMATDVAATMLGVDRSKIVVDVEFQEKA